MSEAEHKHPSDAQYVGIAGILAVVTAIEVALSYVDLGNGNNPLLLLGMVIKFFIVASFFMHLRFDSKVLRRLMITGLVLAVGCYLAVFAMFRTLPFLDHPQDIDFTPSGITQS